MLRKISINTLMKWSWFLLTLLMIIITISYRYFVEIPTEERAVQKLYKRELNALYYSLTQTFNNLYMMNKDYALWDDTYAFIADQNSEYLISNFADQTFINLGIDAVFIVDHNNNILFKKGWDHSREKALVFSKLDDNGKFSATNLLNFNKGGDANPVGMFSTENGAMIFSISNITDTDARKPSTGKMIFFQRFDQNTADILSKETQLSLTIIPFSPKYKHTQKINLMLQDKDIKASDYWLVEDINQQPLFVLNVKHQQKYDPKILTSEIVISIMVQLSILAFMYLLIRQLFLKAIKNINNEITAMANTKSIAPIESQTKISEFQFFSTEFNHLVNTVKDQQLQLEKLSTTDSLTQVPNRLAFEQHFAKEWAHLHRNNIPFAIVMCDIDYFKKYNDSLGHLQGDEALKQVAKALAMSSRRINDIVARYGGEEFVILFGGIDFSGLQMKLNEIIESINALNIAHPDSDIAPHITLSLGATLMTPVRNINEKPNLIRAMSIADNALYLAKSKGRNRAEIAIDK
ncbi:diguanylate cyclase [Thalassotalea psychrophila]|uniref:diguanylate cyclase n=1 Tax=Thalassotalea psychrophila TaxID=3065647 RepID=A0ABY9TSB4_9GAMM|nr:diguanylate cyclase [Colwelliaceae bacterium SQ149]